MQEYQEAAKRIITPEPSTEIRVMMGFQAFDSPKIIEEEILSNTKVERKGFTVVEWGGCELPATNEILLTDFDFSVLASESISL
ncbi:MAG: hypothetical protein KKD31_01200 [Bacteroidetes bacterium]|nr:hypothetical protein [Bacteroidota bacterium]